MRRELALRTATPPPVRRIRDDREICPACGRYARHPRRGLWYRHRTTATGPYAWCYGPAET